jgi:large exoprotein involved in heme utilization and adhesion
MLIVATKGKLRLQGKDVEIVAVGDNGSNGNVTIRSTESITLDSKKVLTNASSLCKIVSSGKVEMAANSCMKIYASVAKISTDASANIDSKSGTRRFQRQNNRV